MCDINETRKAMQRQGWVLVSNNTPGIYIRTSEAIANDKFDWRSVPEGLLRLMEDEANGRDSHVRIRR